MPLPPLTHLQFLVASSLINGELTGSELRDCLKAAGVRKSLPAFYQLMSRMEEAGFVEGRYETKRVENETIKQRYYRVTGEGVRGLSATQEFYLRRMDSNPVGLRPGMEG